MPGVEELTTEEAEQVADVSVEAEAPAEAAAPEAELAPGEAAPEVQAAAPEAATPQTASEQAYGSDELGPEDRNALLVTAERRIEAALSPFTLACSNRRDELRARANNAKLVGTLGKIGFGDLLPGIQRGNPTSGIGMPAAAGHKVSKLALKSGHMKKTLGKINKIPMLNFNLNYPGMVESETAEEFVDILSASAAAANEALRVGLDGYSNEDLAALCAAFDPKANATSIFEDHIDAALAKMETDVVDDKAEELEQKVAEKQADAAAGDPDEAKKHEELAAKKAEGGGDKVAAGEHVAKAKERDQVLEQMPDEMRDLYDDRAYSRV